MVDLNFVFLHGIYKILPFYLEDSILYTVFEGKEVKLRKITEEEINTALEKLGINQKFFLKNLIKKLIKNFF